MKFAFISFLVAFNCNAYDLPKDYRNLRECTDDAKSQTKLVDNLREDLRQAERTIQLDQEELMLLQRKLRNRE